jgi:copper(I)-binding protein
MGASANQVTSAMILNIANIRIKNNMIVMVSDLPSRHELHGQIRNKRNIMDMKKVRRKSVLSSYRKRGIHQ